jgi:ABC-type taurine transport system ATPase subunit
MEKQAIIADKLVYAYPGQDEQDSQVVFEGLDLAIAQGSFVAILGTTAAESPRWPSTSTRSCCRRAAA